MLTTLSRRHFLCWLAPAGGAYFAAVASAEDLDVRLVEDRIRVTAPRLHFVAGRALERLQNGAPVPFALQLSLSIDRNASILLRDIQRFVLSYDLWEEKYAVTKLGQARKSASHLAPAAVEKWCIDEMSLATSGVAEQQPFWLRLEVRAENPGEDAGFDSAQGPTLSHLIEVFSRRTRGDQARWEADAGPFRLAELRRAGAAVR